MAIDVDLRNELITSLEILSLLPEAGESGRVQQNKIDEQAALPRLWFQRRSWENPVLANGTGGLITETFDLECISDDLDEAMQLADAVRETLHGIRDLWSSGYARVEVQDQDDSYLVRNQEYHFAALFIEIVYNKS